MHGRTRTCQRSWTADYHEPQAQGKGFKVDRTCCRRYLEAVLVGGVGGHHGRQRGGLHNGVGVAAALAHLGGPGEQQEQGRICCMSWRLQDLGYNKPAAVEGEHTTDPVLPGVAVPVPPATSMPLGTDIPGGTACSSFAGRTCL